MLERLARLMYRRRRRVVAAWLLAVVALSVAASSWAGEHRADYAVPGSDSARAQALLMELLGDRNWWMPRWLDRLLPRIDVEGATPPETELAVEPMAA